MSNNPRKVSANIVYNVMKRNSTLSDELSKWRRNNEISKLDMRMISEISTGTIRNLQYLDYAISLASDIKLTKISPYVLSILRIGTYQILFMDRIPQSAAVNECVKVIKSSSNRRLAGFVNAVLHKIIINGKDFSLPKDKISSMCIKYSCPEWIVSLWQKRLDGETEELVKCMNEKPSTILRVNTLKTTTERLIERLNSEGWMCTKYESPVFTNIDYLIKAEKIENIEASPAYNEGLFYIQDSAGAYVGEVLNPKKNSVVFDMCASPGGKTTHIAEKMMDSGTIYAFDVSENKIKRINQNLSRLEITSVTAKVWDSSVTDESLYESADYVLVDAPCSGLGIIRKKPDIKYTRKQEDISSLSKISLGILNASAPYVKHGGTMVFSTCTTTYEENEGVLKKFLDTNPDFHLKMIDCAKENDGYITLYPHRDDCDGFFISLITRD